MMAKWACLFGHHSSRVGTRSSSALASARQLLENELESIRQAGTYKHERIITSKQAVSVQVQGQLRPLLNFCANNYLGLSVITIGINFIASVFLGSIIKQFVCVFRAGRVIRKLSRQQ